MTCNVRKLGQINIPQLINSVKVRPALYNKDNIMYYSHKKFKYKLWEEICQEVCRDWDSLAPHKKLEYARELQKRWKSLRTCFAREVALQKKDKLKMDINEPFRRRKKYEYFDSLIFLLNPDNDNQCTTNDNSNEEDPLDLDARTVEYEKASKATAVEYEHVSKVTAIDYENAPNNTSIEEANLEILSANKDVEGRTQNSSQVQPEKTSAQEVAYEPTLPVDDKLLGMIRDTRYSENDEDRMFALSLVSIFKNLGPKKKMEARIKVLKLLQTLTFETELEDQYD